MFENMNAAKTQRRLIVIRKVIWHSPLKLCLQQTILTPIDFKEQQMLTPQGKFYF